MNRLRLMFFTMFLIAGPAFGQDLRTAPRMEALASNQLKVAGNACGPAALLSAFRFGEIRWDNPVNALEKETDREQVLAIIRRYGGRSSNSLKGHQRWSKRGVNLADLTDIANEMGRPFFLPQLKAEVFQGMGDEASGKVFRNAHDSLRDSLKDGFPPVLSVRRFVYRNGEWSVLSAHFVTLISLPDRLEENATSFPIIYLDPWGGRRCDGVVSVQAQGYAAGLPVNPEVDFPQTPIGKSLVKANEGTVVVLSAAILR
ncbi:MAG: hypothetical protein QM680_10215 [Luteolibacter sp.]